MSPSRRCQRIHANQFESAWVLSMLLSFLSVTSSKLGPPPPLLLETLGDLDDYALVTTTTTPPLPTAQPVFGLLDSEQEEAHHHGSQRLALAQLDTSSGAEVALAAEERLARHRTAMAGLASAELSDETSIEHLTEWVRWYSKVEDEDTELKMSNEAQLGSNEQTLQGVAHTANDLDMEKLKLLKYKNEVLDLEAAVQSQKRYAEACRTEAQTLQTKVSVIQSWRAKEHAVAVKSTVNETVLEDKLQDENEMLRARLAKSRQNLETINHQIIESKYKYEALEAQAPTNYIKLRNSLGRLRGKSGTLGKRIELREKSRLLARQRVAAVQAQLGVVQSNNDGVRYENMQNMNAYLKKALAQAHGALIASQQTKTKAVLDKLKYTRLKALAEKASDEATKGAALTARKALVKVAEVWKPAKDLEAKAEAAVQNTEGRSLQPCSEIWDEEHDDVLAELKGPCVDVLRDLDSTTALVTSLSTSVSEG